MSNPFSFFDELQKARDKDKCIELKVQVTKLPYTVVEIGGPAEYKVHKALMLVQRQAEVEAKAKAWAERRESIVASFYSKCKEMLTVTPEKVEQSTKNECECGAESLGSNHHSTWCPTYTYGFERAKTSNNKGYV